MGILAKLFGGNSNCVPTPRDESKVEQIYNSTSRMCTMKIVVVDISNGFMVFFEDDPAGNMSTRTSAYRHSATYCKDLQEVHEQILTIYAKHKMSI